MLNYIMKPGQKRMFSKLILKKGLSITEQLYHSVLLYPKSKEQKDVIGQFALPMSNQVHSCQLAFASVLKIGALNKDLANQVMDKLKY